MASRLPRRKDRSPWRAILLLLLVAVGWHFFHEDGSNVPYDSHRRVARSANRPPVYIWVFDLEKAKGQAGSLHNIVKQVKDNGCAGMIVCSNRGDRWLSNRKDFKTLCELAHAEGLTVTAYARGLAKNPKGEGQRAIESFLSGADDYMFDMESEYQTPTGASDAQITTSSVLKWCKQHHKAKSDLGFTSFGLPSYHRAFPWKTLKPNCAYMAPQWYTTSWQYTQGWSFDQGLEKIRKEYSSNEYPLAPVLQAYGRGTGFEYVKPEELARMLRFSVEMRAISISIFRYELMDDAHWREIQKFNNGAN